ncbi:MAG: hypothetical protein RLZZ502_861 [Pseudomonadota bacterium]|jgi:2-hydroxycyclohexanecarboxyl-CoA dehydrogenase
MRGINNKVVLVTGAAGGIGRALVQRFLAEGARVVALDVNAEGLRQFDERVLCTTLDITDHAAVRSSVQAIHQQCGRIDVLVNNAGWDLAMQFVDSTPDFWDKVIAINLKGPLNLQHAVLPYMMQQGAGKIINIASDAGRVGSSGESVYSACKGGMISFSKTLARETASKGVLVNAVCPGPTDTALFRTFAGEGEFGQKLVEGLKRAIPLKRLAQPDDLAGMVAFLASDDANFITGQVISVSGGLTMNG